MEAKKEDPEYPYKRWLLDQGYVEIYAFPSGCSGEHYVIWNYNKNEHGEERHQLNWKEYKDLHQNFDLFEWKSRSLRRVKVKKIGHDDYDYEEERYNYMYSLHKKYFRGDKEALYKDQWSCGWESTVYKKYLEEMKELQNRRREEEEKRRREEEEKRRKEEEEKQRREEEENRRILSEKKSPSLCLSFHEGGSRYLIELLKFNGISSDNFINLVDLLKEINNLELESDTKQNHFSDLSVGILILSIIEHPNFAQFRKKITTNFNEMKYLKRVIPTNIEKLLSFKVSLLLCNDSKDFNSFHIYEDIELKSNYESNESEEKNEFALSSLIWSFEEMNLKLNECLNSNETLQKLKDVHQDLVKLSVKKENEKKLVELQSRFQELQNKEIELVNAHLEPNSPSSGPDSFAESKTEDFFELEDRDEEEEESDDNISEEESPKASKYTRIRSKRNVIINEASELLSKFQMMMNDLLINIDQQEENLLRNFQSKEEKLKLILRMDKNSYNSLKQKALKRPDRDTIVLIDEWKEKMSEYVSAVIDLKPSAKDFEIFRKNSFQKIYRYGGLLFNMSREENLCKLNPKLTEEVEESALLEKELKKEAMKMKFNMQILRTKIDLFHMCYNGTVKRIIRDILTNYAKEKVIIETQKEKVRVFSENLKKVEEHFLRIRKSHDTHGEFEKKWTDVNDEIDEAERKISQLEVDKVFYQKKKKLKKVKEINAELKEKIDGLRKMKHNELNPLVLKGCELGRHIPEIFLKFP